jgi:cAMP response element-binding protein, invertebrate
MEAGRLFNIVARMAVLCRMFQVTENMLASLLGAYFLCIPFSVNLVGGNVIAEDQSRKREMRLLKNREAARECRRKKKEYIKCLENRVAVLENQNKVNHLLNQHTITHFHNVLFDSFQALIEELKSLKELYCQQKTD